MNKIVTSALIIGVGAVAYNYAQKNKIMSSKQMKNMKRKMMNVF